MIALCARTTAPDHLTDTLTSSFVSLNICLHFGHQLDSHTNDIIQWLLTSVHVVYGICVLYGCVFCVCGVYLYMLYIYGICVCGCMCICGMCTYLCILFGVYWGIYVCVMYVSVCMCMYMHVCGMWTYVWYMGLCVCMYVWHMCMCLCEADVVLCVYKCVCYICMLSICVCAMCMYMWYMCMYLNMCAHVCMCAVHGAGVCVCVKCRLFAKKIPLKV